MKTTKPEKMIFQCSFCGNIWEADNKDFKMQEKVIGLLKKHWIFYIATCPECHREVTLQIPKK